MELPCVAHFEPSNCDQAWQDPGSSYSVQGYPRAALLEVLSLVSRAEYPAFSGSDRPSPFQAFFVPIPKSEYPK